MKNREKVKNRKKHKLSVKRLVKKYPWLIPTADWYSGRILKKRKWNYSWTWYDDMPKGWKKCFGNMLLEELDKAIRKAGLVSIYGVDQVKEKYGRLCWYHHGFNDEINQIVTKYEYISENICIICSRPDTPMVNDTWISPICWDCFYKHEKKQEKWYLENYKNYKLLTKEEIYEKYKKMTSDNNKDWEICNSYIIKTFSKNKEIVTNYDISDTVSKIRKKYYGEIY